MAAGCPSFPRRREPGSPGAAALALGPRFRRGDEETCSPAPVANRRSRASAGTARWLRIDCQMRPLSSWPGLSRPSTPSSHDAAPVAVPWMPGPSPGTTICDRACPWHEQGAAGAASVAMSGSQTALFCRGRGASRQFPLWRKQFPVRAKTIPGYPSTDFLYTIEVEIVFELASKKFAVISRFHGNWAGRPGRRPRSRSYRARRRGDGRRCPA